MDVYRKSQQERYVHMANRWTLSRENRISDDCGLVCSIREVSTRAVAIMLTVAAPHPPDLSTCFLDVLVEWGSTWMWENLQLIGDEGWLEISIRDGSVLAVTDGSYIKELYPNLCSVSFILECTKGRGRII